MRKRLPETAFVFLISIGVVTANAWHVITRWMLNPQDRFFTGIAHYFADYFLYVSQIAQGVSGNWIVSEAMYTNEPIPDAWTYWPNVLLGRIGSVFTTNPFLIYNAGLVICVTLLLFMLWHLVRRVFPAQPFTREIAFLFLATASNFPDIRALVTNGTFGLAGDTWFSPTPALNRLGGVPHQTLQTILILCVILLLPKCTKFLSFHTIVFALTCFLAATLSPIQMLLLCGAMVLTMLIGKKHYSALTGVAAAALGAYLVNRSFDASPLYVFAKQWEAAQTASIALPAFLLGLGPVVLVIPFGIRTYLKSTTPLRILLLLYGAASLLTFFTPIPKLLGTSPTRWIHPASFVVLYLIAAEGFVSITKKAPLLMIILTALYVFLTIPALAAQINARKTIPYDLNHVPNAVITALRAARSLPGNGVILTDPDLPYDVIVPIFSGKPSFTGHPVHTLYPETKSALRTRFFEGSMTAAERKQFFADHRIGYLFTDDDGTFRIRAVSP